VTINRGTSAYGKTMIGNDVLLMASTHIAHDCIVGNNVIMANIATLGGHVEIGDWCNIGGGAMIHQFVKIGRQTLIGGGFSAKQDVPPFIIGAGIPLRFVGVNKVGLERRGFSEDIRGLIKKTYRTYFKSKFNRGQALKIIKNEISQIDEVKEIVSFIESSSRGII
jgi:UDP-N-acetylglucosamine acyltransferase